VFLATQHEEYYMGQVIESIHVADQDLVARTRLLEQQMADIRPRVPDNKVSIILLSGDFDKAIAAFFMANGAAAMGMEVTMFFHFLGLYGD